ncbi:MAG TPA: response regulator transcription factor [Candidatus Dormibacteraeota bacterium]
MRALLVEDDPRLNRTVCRGLEEAGMSVDAVADGHAAVDAALATAFDVIVLDVMLPGRDGFEVCRELRRRRVRTPVIMLTGRDAVEDRIRGLEVGADDYLIKPFSFQELVARMRALVRRHLDDRGAVLELGPMRLDTVTHTVSIGAQPVELTAKEFAILEYLALHPGQVLSKVQIEEHAWNYDFVGGSNLVEVHIARIRRKLSTAGAPDLIGTMRGVGYRFRHPDRG